MQSGDLNGTTPVEIIAPSHVKNLVWNGAPVTVDATRHRSLQTTLNGAQSISLPQLSSWKVSGR